MRYAHPPSPSVVVGIDGSRSALTAALWAVGEAVSRDIPLRLLYAIESPYPPTASEDSAHALATAQIAIRHAFAAIEACDMPVKIEAEILQGRATDKLMEAGRAAAMLCVGVKGIKHAMAGRAGSTAAKLAATADCPVAVIRGFEPSQGEAGSVVVELDGYSDGEALLQRGIDEALLRVAPLLVVFARHSPASVTLGSPAVAQQDLGIAAALERRLECSTRRHPRLDVQRTIALNGSLLDYLSDNATSVQLVVVGRRRTHGIAEMVGPPSYIALHGTECSVLVCDSDNPL